SYSNPYRRLVRVAIGLLVCDLSATHQTSGFVHHKSHNFCSCCLLQFEEIGNFNYTSWKSCSCQKHRDLVEKWRDAESEQEQEALFDATGVRWSELHLPYWDPTKFLVIDSMHTFFLRLLQHHCWDFA
ncbi:hypothetical protein L208DRAFT_1304264, partial [Tricholoma matsutake]